MVNENSTLDGDKPVVDKAKHALNHALKAAGSSEPLLNEGRRIKGLPSRFHCLDASDLCSLSHASRFERFRRDALNGIAFLYVIQYIE